MGRRRTGLESAPRVELGCNHAKVFAIRALSHRPLVLADSAREHSVTGFDQAGTALSRDGSLLVFKRKPGLDANSLALLDRSLGNPRLIDVSGPTDPLCALPPVLGCATSTPLSLPLDPLRCHPVKEAFFEILSRFRPDCFLAFPHYSHHYPRV